MKLNYTLEEASVALEDLVSLRDSLIEAGDVSPTFALEMDVAFPEVGLIGACYSSNVKSERLSVALEGALQNIWEAIKNVFRAIGDALSKAWNWFFGSDDKKDSKKDDSDNVGTASNNGDDKIDGGKAYVSFKDTQRKLKTIDYDNDFNSSDVNLVNSVFKEWALIAKKDSNRSDIERKIADKEESFLGNLNHSQTVFLYQPNVDKYLVDIVNQTRSPRDATTIHQKCGDAVELLRSTTFDRLFETIIKEEEKLRSLIRVAGKAEQFIHGTSEKFKYSQVRGASPSADDQIDLLEKSVSKLRYEINRMSDLTKEIEDLGVKVSPVNMPAIEEKYYKGNTPDKIFERTKKVFSDFNRLEKMLKYLWVKDSDLRDLSDELKDEKKANEWWSNKLHEMSKEDDYYVDGQNLKSDYAMASAKLARAVFKTSMSLTKGERNITVLADVLMTGMGRYMAFLSKLLGDAKYNDQNYGEDVKDLRERLDKRSKDLM